MAKRHTARFRAQAQAQRDADRIRGQVDAIREAFASTHKPAPVIPPGVGSTNANPRNGKKRNHPRKPSTTVRVAELTLWDESGTPVAAGKLVSHYGNVASPRIEQPGAGFTTLPVRAPNLSSAEPYRPWYSALFATIDAGFLRMDERTQVRAWLARNAWREGN